MLGKLMKYEIRSCGRIFFPFYIIVLVFSILGGLFINFDNGVHDFSFVYLMGMLAAFALFVAAIVLTIVLIVQRFNKSLLGDEGYLMFTLPVSKESLVLSKFLTSLIFIILTVIVSLVSITLVSVMFSYKVDEVLDMGYFFRSVKEVFSQNVGGMAFYSLNYIASYSTFILTIYLVIAICHLNIFSKHKVLSALGSFIVLSVIQSGIEGAIALLVTDDKALAMSENISGFDVNGFFNAAFSVGTYDIIIFAANVIIAVALFFATTILL
ncbi:MAG: hypothetical protein ACI3VR_10385, partial [Intestinibacter sp.]|uniref:hypothetical protein n=1 Tax=Intestinibacter sp. TaxID=1965304 RepID=UPI003F15DDE5